MKTVAKALVAGAIAALALLGGAALDDGLQAGEAVAAVGAGLAAFSAVYFVPNAKPEDEPEVLDFEPSDQ